MAENVFVDSDGTLTIEPGVTVKVRRPDRHTNGFVPEVGLQVFGLLNAQGTPHAMIRFVPLFNKPEPYNEWDGISLNGTKPSRMTWTLVEYAGPGVDCSGPCLIAHCVFRYCHTGIWLSFGFDGDVRHNISSNNCYSGIRSQCTRPEATITDNILFMNGDGLDSWGDALAFADYNLFSSLNRSGNYKHDSMPGKHDIVANPLFSGQGGQDFNLSSNSPARHAASDGGDIGLDAGRWTMASARAEIDRWLDHGAREMLHSATLINGADSRDRCSILQQALAKARQPELHAKILCALGAALVGAGEYDAARKRLPTPSSARPRKAFPGGMRSPDRASW
jgi:hypothetical protein